MTKQELMETYTSEQLADMVVKLNNAMDMIKYSDSLLKSGLFENPAVAAYEARINIMQNKINNLEEDNGRLQAKLDTYNNYLLPRCTKEAKEMIDRNYFSGVRIATLEQWNNSGRADGKVCFPKEYEQTVRGFLNIDTSEIQDDCHRFGIESLQRYLKNPAPIKIPKRDSENIDLSKIQKCQEEYEKLLKESPLEGVMNKITKDILEQKNNAMAMEFTRIICDLMKRYGVYVHCTETKFGEKITTNSIEEQYGIVFDSMDFSQHDKEFTDKIEELQSEVEKYRKAFEDAKKERDCQIVEYRNEIDELNQKLERKETATKYAEEYVYSLKNDLGRSKNTINQIDDILEKLFGVRHDAIGTSDEFEKILTEKVKGNISDFLSTEPIKVADMLINAEGEYEHNPLAKALYKEDKGTYRIFDVSELRQIAEHLLVYCNHNGEAEE